MATLFVGVPLIRLYSRRNAANAAAGNARNVSAPINQSAIAYKGGVHPIKPYNFPQPYTEGRCKGLFIGINYFGTKAELKGCCNDVAVMIDTMKELQFPLQDAAILVDDPKFKGASGLPTRENIIQHMLWLVKDAKAGDVLFFHYSGHGGQAKDPEASPDNPSGMCETMIPSDYKTAGMIADADIFELMVRNLPAGVRLTVIMDCCHSASLMDLPFTYFASEANMNSCSKMTADRRYQTRQTRGDVVMISGVDTNAKAADIADTSAVFKGNSSYGAGGAVTNAFSMVLTRTSGLTVNQLLEEMRKVLVSRGIEQTPQLCASKPIELTQPFSFFGDFTADTHYYSMGSGAAPAAGAPSGAAAPQGAEVELNVWVQPPSIDSASSSSSAPPAYTAGAGAGGLPPAYTSYGGAYGSTAEATLHVTATPPIGATKQTAPLPPPMPTATATTAPSAAAPAPNVPFNMMTPEQQQQLFLQQQAMLQQQQAMLMQFQQQQQMANGGASPPLPMAPTPYGGYSAAAVPPGAQPSAPQSQHTTPAFAAATISPYHTSSQRPPNPFAAPFLPPPPSPMLGVPMMGMGVPPMGMGMALNPSMLGATSRSASVNSNGSGFGLGGGGFYAFDASGRLTPAAAGSSVRRSAPGTPSPQSRAKGSGRAAAPQTPPAGTPPAYRHPPTYEDTLKGSFFRADGTALKPYVRVGLGDGVPVPKATATPAAEAREVAKGEEVAVVPEPVATAVEA